MAGPRHIGLGICEVADDVAFLSAFLKALDIQKAHMVGSSLGGLIAWQYALDFPQQVKSLTLMNALGYPQASWPPPIEMGQWPIVGTLISQRMPDVHEHHQTT